MTTWTKQKLGDVIDFIDGDRGTNYPSEGDFFQSGKCLFLNTKNVPNSKFSFEEKLFIDAKKDEVLRKGKLQRGDYVLTTRGTVGNFAYYDESIPYNNVRINSGMVILRKKVETLDEEFFRYYLSSNSFSGQVKSRTTGSAQPQLPIKDMVSMEIALPDLSTQSRIASILSTYDDLIENNEKRINTLEEMAQLLYTEWFVKFKFPGYEKVKMVDSGTEYGKIPEGWEVKRLKDIGKAVTGKTPPTGDLDNFGGEVLFIKTPDIHGNIFVIKTERTLSSAGSELQALKFLPEKTIFVSCIGTLGVVGITAKPSQTNQQINALILNDRSDYILFYYFSKNLKQQLVGLGSNGATMGNVNKDKFEHVQLLYPNKQNRQAFFNRTSDVFDEILTLQQRNEIISKTRDLLIPQLVTGKRELK
jgi:type I restriction enzyme S subunit